MPAGDDVLLRLTTGRTTYHFGRLEAICGEVSAREATAMELDDALAMNRRLCAKWERWSTRGSDTPSRWRRRSRSYTPIASCWASSRNRHGRETANREQGTDSQAAAAA